MRVRIGKSTFALGHLYYVKKCLYTLFSVFTFASHQDPVNFCSTQLQHSWCPAAGVLGENLIIPTFLADAVSKFWILNGSVLAFCFIVFYLIVLCLKQKRLM